MLSDPTDKCVENSILLLLLVEPIRISSRSESTEQRTSGLSSWYSAIRDMVLWTKWSYTNSRLISDSTLPTILEPTLEVNISISLFFSSI